MTEVFCTPHLKMSYCKGKTDRWKKCTSGIEDLNASSITMPLWESTPFLGLYFPQLLKRWLQNPWSLCFLNFSCSWNGQTYNRLYWYTIEVIEVYFILLIYIRYIIPYLIRNTFSGNIGLQNLCCEHLSTKKFGIRV